MTWKRKPTRYGIYDTTDQLWIGDQDGPAVFEDRATAQISAQALAIRTDVPQTRYKPKRLPRASWRKRDELKTVCTGEQAIARLESGSEDLIPPTEITIHLEPEN